MSMQGMIHYHKFGTYVNSDTYLITLQVIAS